ncbi:amino acid adenylation domain-containing protein [Bacillus velezensis]|uniref:non-ribosomal peptide synthetase n=2 Tax=Bacillus velezensis TaxID=492670 RepID=UPI00100F309B|nr:non-ribosomal peptide synthetase [Bacillus velezensis]QEQ04513.1 amino acid adenylation domain-containing protein [Bacillus velezensis]
MINNTLVTSNKFKEISNFIIKKIRELSKDDSVDLRTNIFDYQISSINILKLLGAIEDTYNINIEFYDYIDNPDVLSFCQVVYEKFQLLDNEKEYNILHLLNDEENAYKEFDLTNVQVAYLSGRDKQFELGGTSTHAFVEFEAELDIEKFNKSVQAVIERQHMLRAVFLSNGKQKILEHVPNYKLAIQDVSYLKKSDQEDKILEARKVTNERIFDPYQWPLFEFKALKISDKLYRIFFDIDMLIADGASIQLLFKEISELYNGKIQEPLEVSYRDYMLVYNKLKGNHKYQDDKEYWLNKLKSFPSTPALPVKVDLACIKKPTFKRKKKIIEKRNWNQFVNLCSRKNIRPSILLLAIYSKVLSKWSNQQNIALNTTLFKRRPLHKQINNVIGDFTEIMIFDVCFNNLNHFWEEVKNIQDNFFKCLSHNDFDGIEFTREYCEFNDIDRRKAVFPIVFTSMLFENELNYLDSLGVFIESISQTSQVYLDHQVIELNDGVMLSWDYVSEAFENDVIESMFEEYTHIIDQLTSGEMMSSEDTALEQAITDYNQTEKAIKPDTLYHLFARQTIKTPENLAIECQGRAVTYQELQVMSNRISSFLEEKGIQPNEYVGVIVDRKIETIASILAVLKIGAAYIPINPEFPKERQSYIVKDGNCKVVLTAELAKTIVSSYKESKRESVAVPEQIAYAIYTSGSTGKPKGVIIKNEAVTNTILDINEKYSVNETDRFIGLSSMSFDLSIYDIFGAFSAGATLVMIEDQRDIKKIHDIVKEEKITVWNSVPMIMEMLVNYMDETESKSNAGVINYDELPELRLVLLSGDWIPVHLPERIKDHFVESEVISLGGATEASIWSIYYPIKTVKDEWTSIPYGYPLSNQTYYVLNYENDPCPIGVKGELYIGGKGVAEGYLNDKEKTEASFIDHPDFGRIYRTGDMGVLTQEGYIEFLGRKDHQIKVRGYRVELGEIESVILEHRQVRNAVVINQKDARNQDVLYAYVAGHQSLPPTDLKEFLSLKVPEYMIPSYIVQIEEVPLTSNGKVDRKKLLALDVTDQASIGRKIKEPRTEIERDLVDIWKSVLKTDEISIDDNFFELGGNSILIINLITAIEDRLFIKLDFKNFISNSTIEKLAKVISVSERKSKTNSNVMEIQADIKHKNTEFDLTNVQMAYLMGRDKQFELGGTSTHAYLEIETELNIEKLNKSLQKVIDHQDMLRAVILPNGRQKILQQVPQYEISVQDISQLSDIEQEKKIAEERDRTSHHIFNPNEWPLFEFKALKIQGDKHRLFFDIDMLIADGASIQLLFKQISELYNGKDEMVPLEISYRDYMLAYQKVKTTQKYENDKAYWLSQLKDFPKAPAVPLKERLDAISKPTFKRKSKIIDKLLWETLCKKAASYNITPAIILFTAYAKVLSKWSNQQNLAVNTTVFNRQPLHKQVNDIIGDFTSLIMLKASFEKKMNFWEEAKKVQVTFMEALEHRDYDGVEFIREYARYNNLKHKSATMPVVFTSMLFGNMFNLNNNDLLNIGELKMAVSQTSQVYLDHQVIELNDGVMLSWDYVSEAFENDVIESMFEEYTYIIDQLTSGEMMSSEDTALEQAITDYNQTEKAIKPDTLYHLFARQTIKTPENIAIECQGRAVTYQELQVMSNRISSFLEEKGIQPNEYVGVIVDREIETIASILAVLKIGAAYIPINPEFPKERQSYIVKDGNCKVVLTAELVKTIVSSYKESKRESVAVPEQIAYAIYTSGSTGKPKGVIIKNEAVINTILDINEKYSVNETDRFIGLSSMSFDLSIYDIFGAFSAGATLVMIEDQRDIKKIHDIVKEEKITVWNSVPMIMEMLVNYMDETENKSNAGVINYDELPELRLVLLSGDWIPVHLLERIKDHFVESEVISLGGATEASIWSIYYPIKTVKAEWTSIPYGYPLSNQTYYVLNYENDPCPIGVKGELYIGGRGVAEGYLNDKEKTEASFIDHPDFGRIYRTGDMGVLTQEGYIEFLGRKDHQIKVRGYRVELGEIESVILEHRQVRNAVVINQKDARNQDVLYAYVAGHQSLPPTDLKEFLSLKVPEYMIPSYIVQIEEVPLTSNGKVDRKKLLALDVTDQASIGRKIKEPRTEIERDLVDIWKSVLKTDEISIDDNFFELGGNSISLSNIYTKIEKKYSDLNIVDLFKYQKISELSHFISVMKEENKNLKLKSVKLPPKILANRKDNKNEKTIILEKQLKIKFNLEVSNKVINTFLYLFSNFIENDEYYVSLLKSSYIDLEKINIEEYSDLTEFIKNIEENKIKRKTVSKINLRSNLGLERDNAHINVLIIDKQKVKNNISESYEFIFSYLVNDNNINLELIFKNNKLREISVEKFFNTYINIISDLI